jgi:hypothetical protein
MPRQIPETPEEARQEKLYRQVRRLPDQLARARQRVAQLETMARRLGLHDLVKGA